MDLKPDEVLKFDEIKTRCKYVRGIYGDRNKIMDAMENIFMLIWNDNQPTNPNIVKFICPDARNKLQGGHRLLKATEPKVRVPAEKNDAEAQKISSNLEMAGAALFYANSRLFDIPIHEEAIKSAMLFGEIQGGITLTQDLKEAAEKGGNEAYKLRIGEITKRTPAIVEFYDPRTGYPIIDKLGMEGYHRAVRMTEHEVINAWGDEGRQAINGAKAKQKTKKEAEKESAYTNIFTHNDYMDWEYHCVWLEEADEAPLMLEKHGMPELPIVYRTASGSNLHSRKEYKTQPFLYGVYKSGLYEALNMAYTMLYDHMFTIGSSGNLVYEANKEDKVLKIDWGTKGGSFTIAVGEKVYQAPLPALDPAVIRGIEMGERKLSQSTIYDQALGEALGSNAPYSMVALLNHAGRLPLLDAQRAASWAFGDIIEKTFRIMKKNQKGTSKIQTRTGYVELKAKDIPEDFIVNVGVEIDLPQDMKQNAMIANSLIANKIASKEWTRGKLMQIEQSDEMDKAILIEDLVMLFAQMQVQQVMAAAQQAAQPTPGGPTPGPEGGPPPQEGSGQGQEMVQQMMNMSPEQITEMMTKGGIPPEAQAAVLAKLGMGDGASMGNPMTAPKELPGDGTEGMELGKLGGPAGGIPRGM